MAVFIIVFSIKVTAFLCFITEYLVAIILRYMEIGIFRWYVDLELSGGFKVDAKSSVRKLSRRLCNPTEN